MGAIHVAGVGKAYRRYASPLARLAEWLIPGAVRHRLDWTLRDISFDIPAGQLSGLTAEEVAVLMPDIQAFADIGKYIDQPVRTYSSGMQVRLAFSVATALRPDILIVDEALAVGDIFFQQKCYDRIRAYCAAGTTLLFVSHAMDAVYALCDRAILLDAGRIVWDGSPREAIDLYDLYHAKVLASADTPAPSDAQPAEAPLGSFNSEHARIIGATLLADGQPVRRIASGTAVTVQVRAEFDAPFDDIHVGFQVRNSVGEAVFMTNTYCMGRRPGAVRAGERLQASFPFTCSLAPGDYSITCGIANGGYGEGACTGSLRSERRRRD